VRGLLGNPARWLLRACRASGASAGAVRGHVVGCAVHEVAVWGDRLVVAGAVLPARWGRPWGWS